MANLSGYGIKKIIPKPLKIDQLFTAITDILHIEFEIDNTPCILEARVNDNIIFIEIAQGLNREKIDLLKYKIQELIALYNLTYPKVPRHDDRSLPLVHRRPESRAFNGQHSFESRSQEQKRKNTHAGYLCPRFYRGRQKLYGDPGRKGSFARDRLPSSRTWTRTTPRRLSANGY